METGLKLLMRDGALDIKFHPRLTPEQYAELAWIINQPTTKVELCEAVGRLAKRWGIEVVCEDAI